MSVSALPATILGYAEGMRARIVQATKQRIDDALVRFDGWWLIFIAVILALGAVLIAGMAVWCVVYQGKRFTGRWQYENFGLQVYFECV
jgi:hypothetical protein